MKSNPRPSSNTVCQKCNQKPSDALCFTCNLLLCFSCCIFHSQTNTTHVLKDLPQSIDLITKKSKQLIYNLQHKLSTQQQQPQQQDSTSNILHPENFQRYLDQIDFIKKQVLKFVDKFFNELSLEFVNMWEGYLLKFTTGAMLVERIEQLLKWLKPYAEMEGGRAPGFEAVRMFVGEGYEDKAEELMRKSVKEQQKMEEPECPRVVINERILAQLEQTLCRTIHTVNYHFNKPLQPIPSNSPPQLIINTKNTLDANRRTVPIFPMRGRFCFLFNPQTAQYQIQQFQKLDILPAYPKTILLPSGDLHLIGGIDQNNNLLSQHLVFRHHKGEIAKLSPLPQPKNPSNALAYHSNMIYLVGGLKQKGGWDNECLQYDVRKNQWRKIEGMNSVKPHQTVVVYNNSIVVFGLSFNENSLNIERLDLETMKWRQLSVCNLLSNPFNFAAGFSSIQINPHEVLLFGGKTYQDSLKSNKRSTDKSVSPLMFLFNPQSCSFTQLDKLCLATGTQFGEINPIIIDNQIYTFEFLLSKVNPLVRWYDTIQCVRIGGEVECVAVMQEN